MMMGFLSKTTHRRWLAAIFGLLLFAGILVWLSD